MLCNNEMKIYYNEWNTEKAQWLRELIKEQIIPEGDIDERDIKQIEAKELKEYNQCHFFAGIGGWAYALQLAKWPVDRSVWTGSCPCQPFSTAGNKKGQRDERHLWPYWFRLIRESKPTTIFGEQVANAIRKGWVDDVFFDLEKEDYACASSVLSACCVEAPHERNRIWFVSHAKSTDDCRNAREFSNKNGGQKLNNISESGGAGPLFRNVENSNSYGQQESRKCGDRQETLEKRQANYSFNTDKDGVEWVLCSDGKIRPIKSGVPLLVNGLSPNFRKLCAEGFGDAIVPELAAEFIKAFMEIINPNEPE